MKAHLVALSPRKLILVRGKEAEEYWGYCEEAGCDVWDLLAALPLTLDEPKGWWLPESMRLPGTSRYVMGVEAPLDWKGSLPEGAEVVDFPPGDWLVFQGPPYEESQMGEAISSLREAIEGTDPGEWGMEWADDRLPSWQMAPLPSRGVIEGRPVRPSV